MSKISDKIKRSIIKKALEELLSKEDNTAEFVEAVLLEIKQTKKLQEVVVAGDVKKVRYYVAALTKAKVPVKFATLIKVAKGAGQDKVVEVLQSLSGKK